MPTSASALVVWRGAVTNVFPPGAHVFPVDLVAIEELANILGEEVGAVHTVPVETLLQGHSEGSRPFPLVRLLDFLARRRPSFDLAARMQVEATSREHGRRRVAELRALGAPEILVATEKAELASWSPAIDLAVLVPDIVSTAALVDPEHRAEGELVVDADLTDLILLAAQACTDPAVPSIEEEPLEWRALVPEHEEPSPAGMVLVHGGLDSDRCERLDFARRGDLGLLAVTMARNE